MDTEWAWQPFGHCVCKHSNILCSVEETFREDINLCTIGRKWELLNLNPRTIVKQTVHSLKKAIPIAWNVILKEMSGVGDAISKQAFCVVKMSINTILQK